MSASEEQSRGAERLDEIDRPRAEHRDCGDEGRADGLPSQSPDLIEQEWGDELDNIIPTRGYQMTPMVGLGGSAGSIPALTEFFHAMPADAGMIFVVVLHLAPDHVSTLADILGRATRMPVVQATNGQKVETNSVYVIPPGKYLATVDGHLKLTDFEPSRGKRMAVDLFFRSLADTHGPHSAAVVLSGVDGDGALGIKRVKERGGLTIAQDPDEAQHEGMPRASIETGMIDWVLEIADMPRRLLDYFDHERRLKLPPEDGPPPASTRAPAQGESEAALREVLSFLRSRTGRDFSYYKRATILRRIARRMQVNMAEDLLGYLSLLRTQPGEAGALLQDLLISVTNFFRDREAFAALERRIPGLFKGKSQNEPLRVWVPACATGEEAYSIAILLLEHARKLEAPPVLQVFACDLDEQAIQAARAGHYPEAIAADVSDERLARFFAKEHHGYRMRREVREMVLFASHDLLKDAPFSRMDLISCRNLLIYLNRSAQQRVFDIFQFALKPNGVLFLGSSEAVDEGNPAFQVLDKKHRIYARGPAARAVVPLPESSSSLLRIIEAQEQSRAASPVIHGKDFSREATATFHAGLGQRFDRAALAEWHLKILERLGPPSVLVNAEYEIVHLSEHAGQFLQFPGGEPSSNLLRVVHPALQSELRAALFRAAETDASVEIAELPVEIDGQSQLIDLLVAPAREIASGFLLVTFQSRGGAGGESGEAGARPKPRPARPKPQTRTEDEPAVRHLERELVRIKGHLRDTVEQYEASTEELKASNEELQAMNEELRSATEELETSREELQSINEELTTVNQEMKSKVDELARANSDLQNLMASTSIATVFLDRDLAIKRYTPSAAAIFHMIPGDVGRPLAHLKHQLDYPEMIDHAEEVLRTLVPIEREVRGEGRWFLARLQPYRTLEDHIAGTVLTFIDVTDRKRASEALRLSEERMRILIESARDYAIFTIDPDRRVDGWNSGAQAMFGYTEQEIVGQSADVLFTPEDRAHGDPEREMRTARDEGRAANERWHARQDGSTFYGSGMVMPLRENNGPLRGYVKIMRDLTEAKRVEEELHARMDELTRFNAAAVAREARMIELKEEINALRARLDEPPRYLLDVAGDGPNPEAEP